MLIVIYLIGGTFINIIASAVEGDRILHDNKRSARSRRSSRYLFPFSSKKNEKKINNNITPLRPIDEEEDGSDIILLKQQQQQQQQPRQHALHHSRSVSSCLKWTQFVALSNMMLSLLNLQYDPIAFWPVRTLRHVISYFDICFVLFLTSYVLFFLLLGLDETSTYMLGIMHSVYSTTCYVTSSSSTTTTTTTTTSRSQYSSDYHTHVVIMDVIIDRIH
jgi:hypothetical protein